METVQFSKSWIQVSFGSFLRSTFSASVVFQHVQPFSPPRKDLFCAVLRSCTSLLDSRSPPSPQSADTLLLSWEPRMGLCPQPARKYENESGTS